MDTTTSASPIGVHLTVLADPAPACNINKCPGEILMMFSEALGANNLGSRASFARTCRNINQAVEPGIYKSDVVNFRGSAMTWAARNGEVGTMKKSMAHGGNVFRRYRLPSFNATGPLLHFAVLEGMDDMVAFLLDQGVNIHRNAKGFCFCPSISKFSRAAESIYLEAGLKIRSHQTALHLAICNGHLSTARLLISRGALDLEKEQLLHSKIAIRAAASFGHHTLFPDILKGRNSEEISAIIGAVFRSNSYINKRKIDALNYGALHHACSSSYSNIETVRALVELGANVNERINVWHLRKGTPLQLAVDRKAMDVAHVLMDLGAKPEYLCVNLADAPTQALGLILHRLLAFDVSFEDVPTLETTRKLLEHAELLIQQKGANLSQALRGRLCNKTSLNGFVLPVEHCEYWDGAAAVMEFLLEHGTPVEQAGTKGRSALATLLRAFSRIYRQPINSEADQLALVEKERRLFEGVTVLIKHGACPTDCSHYNIDSPTFLFRRYPFNRQDDPVAVKLVRMYLEESKCACLELNDELLRYRLWNWLDRATRKGGVKRRAEDLDGKNQDGGVTGRENKIIKFSE